MNLVFTNGGEDSYGYYDVKVESSTFLTGDALASALKNYLDLALAEFTYSTSTESGFTYYEWTYRNTSTNYAYLEIRISSQAVFLTAFACNYTGIPEAPDVENEVLSEYNLPENFKATWTYNAETYTLIRYNKNILFYKNDTLDYHSMYIKYNSANNYTLYAYDEGTWDSGTAKVTENLYSSTSPLNVFITAGLISKTTNGTFVQNENLEINSVSTSCAKYSYMHMGMQGYNWYVAAYTSITVKSLYEVFGMTSTLFTLDSFDNNATGFGTMVVPS